MTPFSTKSISKSSTERRIDYGDEMQISGIRVRPSGGSGNLTFQQFVEELKRFDRSSLLAASSRISWNIWDSDVPLPESEDLFICRAYMPQIAVLAVATCDDSATPRFPTEPEATRLARELLGVRSAMSNLQYRDQIELPALEQALTSSALFKGIVQDRDSLVATHALVSFARDLRAQWAPRSVNPISIFRGWKIAKYLEDRAKGFQSAVKRLWKIELAHLAHCGMALLAMARDSGGLVSLADTSGLDGLPAHLGVDGDVVKLVANRLSRSRSQYEEWYQKDVLAYPELFRKYVPSPFVATPLVLINEEFHHIQAPPPAYVVPSPAHLLWYFQSAPFEAARALSGSWHPDLKPPLGEAVSDYVYWMLVGICGENNVIPLDALFGGSHSSRADFAVLAGEYVLIIESKTSVASAQAKSVMSMQDYVDIWERICAAYVQCTATTRAPEFRGDSRLKSAAKFVHLVTFEEQICLEGAALNAVAAAQGLFDAHGVSRVEAVTLENLEDLLVRLGPARLAEGIAEKWEGEKHGEGLYQYIARRHTSGKPYSDRSYAREEFLDFFKMEAVFDAIQQKDSQM